MPMEIKVLKKMSKGAATPSDKSEITLRGATLLITNLTNL